MSLPVWHHLAVEAVYSRLKTDERGLAVAEAEARHKKYGPNTLPQPKQLGRLEVFVSQFKNPLILILIVAASLSFFLRESVDTVVIAMAVVINTVIGFFQEEKANQAIRKLRAFITHRARVIREGQEMEISAEEVVPGDVMVLQAGDRVPADGRVCDAKDFETNEAGLTGESLPVEKRADALPEGTVLAERNNMVFLGTVVTRGRARVVVTETGHKTHFGETARLIAETPEEKTPLQLRLLVLSKGMSVAVLFVTVGIVCIGLLHGFEFFDILLISVAVAVSAIPEGLTIAVTVILAIGTERILAKKSLARTLLAAETLGSVTVICSDKTGTLTEGKMSVTELLTAKELLSDTEDGKYALKEKDDHTLLLSIGMSCNDAVLENPEAGAEEWRVIGSPTEEALLLAGYGAGIKKEDLDKRFLRVDEIPFSSETKYMATLHRAPRGGMLYAKGAPEKILALCSGVKMGVVQNLTASKRKALEEQCQRLTEKGLRVLALAYKRITKNPDGMTSDDVTGLVFAGFVGMKDPVRAEVKSVIALTRRAGIRPVIITGDHRLTALAVAKEAGIAVKLKEIVDGSELDTWSDAELEKRVGHIIVYARATPKHKIRIVDALQKRGEVVAMAGDGVNDAPAIKSADIGIALGSGTDVTKETADLVLLDNNFATIVEAVKQGRVIFENIKKVVVYLLADSFSAVILVVGSLILQLPLPLLAAQILWVNVIADGFPAFALAFEVGEDEVMKDKPRPKNHPILDTQMKTLIFIIGTVTDMALLGLYVYLSDIGWDLERTRTLLFAALGVDTLCYVYSCKNFRKTLWRYNPFSNKYLNVSVIIGLLCMIVAVHFPPLQAMLRTVPLSVGDWTLVGVLAMIKVLCIELTKWVFLARDGYKPTRNIIKKKSYAG